MYVDPLRDSMRKGHVHGHRSHHGGRVRPHEVTRWASLMRSTRTDGFNTLEKKRLEPTWLRIFHSDLFLDIRLGFFGRTSSELTADTIVFLFLPFLQTSVWSSRRCIFGFFILTELIHCAVSFVFGVGQRKLLQSQRHAKLSSLEDSRFEL